MNHVMSHEIVHIMSLVFPSHLIPTRYDTYPELKIMKVK